MSTIGSIRPATLTPTYTPPAAPVAADVTTASYGTNWNGLDPHGNIFDCAYDAWKMNSFPMSLGGVPFWTGGPMRRAIAAMITGIPTERLQALAVRNQFMKVPGMIPDYARVLQVTYANHTQGQQPLKIGNFGSRVNGPLSWLAQYGAPGGVYDWTLRGPLEVEMNTLSVQMAMYSGFRPSVPGNNALENLARAASQYAPPLPPGYGGYGGYQAPVGYGPAPYGYGDPIQQTIGAIGSIVNIFKGN
jgi:hypothetical protein